MLRATYNSQHASDMEEKVTVTSTVNALCGTDVFALQDFYPLTDPAATQWTDVLARRLRQASEISTPKPRRLEVILSIDAQPIRFAYTSFNGGLPGWAAPVLESLAERWGVQAGWDSYQAKPTNPQIVAKLLNIFSDLMREGSAVPTITPLADGGIQAEWHNHGRDLEIVVSVDACPTYYYYNHLTTSEEEGPLEPNYSHVQDLIEEVS